MILLKVLQGGGKFFRHSPLTAIPPALYQQIKAGGNVCSN